MTKDELLFLKYLVKLNDTTLQTKWEKFLDLQIHANVNNNDNWLETLKKFYECAEKDIKQGK